MLRYRVPVPDPLWVGTVTMLFGLGCSWLCFLGRFVLVLMCCILLRFCMVLVVGILTSVCFVFSLSSVQLVFCLVLVWLIGTCLL